jgi:ornithine decarboxylase
MKHAWLKTVSAVPHQIGHAAGTFADAPEVAARMVPEEPVFCFAKDALQARARAFLDGFPGETAYAVKCNSGAHVLAALGEAGVDVFDTASVQEMAAVKAAVSGPVVFHYHNPVKSRREIADAYRLHGCRRFAADEAQEVAKIAEVTGGGSDIEVAVRFRLPRLGGSSAHDFSTKFGATREEAVELLRDIAARGMMPVLTFHPGSQCVDPLAYASHIEVAAKIASEAGVQLAVLNVGGGFPAHYRGSVVPPLVDYFKVIEETARREFGTSLPQLECEPGRGIVASSTSLLARVKMVRQTRGEIFLNDGIYGALMEVSQVPELAPVHRVIRDGAVLASVPTRAFTLFGPTCDPLDQLPVQFMLPADIRDDDYIEFGGVGAYGAATATFFNGYEPAQIEPVGSVLSGE